MKRHNETTDRQTQLRTDAKKARTKKRKEKLKKQVQRRTKHWGKRIGDLKNQLVNTQRELTAAFTKIEELKAKLPKPEGQENTDVAK
jgi:hypothetical protein